MWSSRYFTGPPLVGTTMYDTPPVFEDDDDDFEISTTGATYAYLSGGRILRYDPLTNTSRLLYTGTGEIMNRARPPASRSAVEGLPRVATDRKDEACVICLEDWLSEGEVAAEMPCKHKFHYECAAKWLGIQASCPVCRYEMPLPLYREDELVNKVEEISINQVVEEISINQVVEDISINQVVETRRRDDDEESIDYYEYYDYTDDDCHDDDDDDDDD